MRNIYPATALVLALGAMSVSCDKIKPPQPELKPQAPIPAPVESAAQQEQRTFMQGAQIELDELRNTIAGLKAKAQTAGAESKEKLIEETQKLEAGLTEAEQQLEKLKVATVESWNQLKETFKTSLDKLKDAVKGATKEKS